MIAAADNQASRSSGPIEALLYVTSEKAPLYRAIMRVFLEAKERFVFDLRPQDVIGCMQHERSIEIPQQSDIDSALVQLCEWGNLQSHADTASVYAIEDFYNPPHTFLMT